MSTLSFQDEEAQFYEAMGRSMSAFAWVEGSLLHVFRNALVSADFPAASAAFFSNIGFNAKLDMTTASVTVRLQNNDMLAEWITLADKLRDLSRRRISRSYRGSMSREEASQEPSLRYATAARAKEVVTVAYDLTEVTKARFARRHNQLPDFAPFANTRS
jgi:hypothetical protein